MRPDSSVRAPRTPNVSYSKFSPPRETAISRPARSSTACFYRTAPPEQQRSSRTAFASSPDRYIEQPKQITMDKAYGATDDTNPFSKAELGEAQDLKPVLAPVFVQPLRSRAKRRRRSGGLLLAAVLAVVVTASKLAQQHPHAALERVAKAVAPASAARASNRGRSPVRPDADTEAEPAPASAERAANRGRSPVRPEAADTEAPVSAERAANRGRSPVRPSVEEDQARRNLRIFLNERMGGAKTQRDGVAPHHRHGEHKIGFGLMAHSRSRRRAMQHLKHLKSAHHSSSFSA